MSIDPNSSGLSAAQASLLVQMMQAQSQADAVNAMMSDSAATSSDSTGSGTSTDSFASLLSAALGGTTDPLAAMSGTSSLSASQLFGMLGQNGTSTQAGNQSIANAATDSGLPSHRRLE